MNILHFAAIIIAGGIAMFMGLMLAEVAKHFFKVYQSRPKKVKPLVIEIESYNPDFLEGWGFIVDGRIILNYDQTPLLFKKKVDAIACLRDKYQDVGELVYQRWDVKASKVYVGEVRKNGTN